MSNASSGKKLYGPGLPILEIVGRSANEPSIEIDAATTNPGTVAPVSSKTKVVAEAEIAQEQHRLAANAVRPRARFAVPKVRMVSSH